MAASEADHILAPLVADDGKTLFYGAEASNDSLPGKHTVSPTWREALDPSVKLREGTVKSSVFTLVSTIIGGGVLSLPFTLAACGLVPGMILLVVMATVSAYSANLLVASAARSGGESYEDIALRVWGPRAALAVSALVLMLVFFASIGYIVLFGDLSTSLFPPLFDCTCGHGRVTNGDVETCQKHNRWAYMGLCLAFIFPGCLLKKMSALRLTSVLSVMSIAFLAGVLIWKSAHDNATSQYDYDHMLVAVDACVANHRTSRLTCIKWFREPDLATLLSIPILACSFMCHFNVLPLHKELRRATRKRMRTVIYATMGLAGLLYSCVAVAGYLDFLSLLLSHQGGNILSLYLPSDTVINVGRAGLLGTIILSFPLLTHPCRSLLEKLVFDKTSWRASTCRHVCITILIVVAAAVIAFVTPDIVVVWSVTGSTDAITVAYVLPPILFLKSQKVRKAAGELTAMHVEAGRGGGDLDGKEDEDSGGWWSQRALPILTCVAGIVTALVCTGASIYNIVHQGAPPPQGAPTAKCGHHHPLPNGTISNSTLTMPMPKLNLAALIRL